MHGKATFALLVVAGFWLGLATSEGRADSSKPPPPIGQFEVLIGRIRTAAASKAWQEPGWKDEKIEAALQELVDAAKTASGREFLQLPIGFQDVLAGRGIGLRGGRLYVASGNLEVPFADKCILLVDGSVHISHAADCIVIARGIADIAHCNRCLVVSGHHLGISHDGNVGAAIARRGAAAPPLTEGSLLVSGGTVNISYAHATTLSAPGRIEISHAHQVAFLGSPDFSRNNNNHCTEHKDFKSPLGIPPPEAFPGKVFTVKQIVATDNRAKQLITVERNGIEYVLRPGAKLTDEKGQPIAGWTNWTLDFVTEDAALFTDGERDRSVYVPAQ